MQLHEALHLCYWSAYVEISHPEGALLSPGSPPSTPIHIHWLVEWLVSGEDASLTVTFVMCHTELKHLRAVAEMLQTLSSSLKHFTIITHLIYPARYVGAQRYPQDYLVTDFSFMTLTYSILRLSMSSIQHSLSCHPGPLCPHPRFANYIITCAEVVMIHAADNRRAGLGQDCVNFATTELLSFAEVPCQDALEGISRT